MSLNVFEKLHDWFAVRTQLKKSDSSIGFVPTMGALHKGHISLMEKSLRENDVTVVSLFVNPTQFNDPKDFEKYPNSLANDKSILDSLGVPYLLTPHFEDIYPDNFAYKVMENNMSHQLCGARREGHFDGVLTIVLKLFSIVQPQKTYFGEKDFQQYRLIKDMVKAFFLPIDVIACPTVREEDGLAMSSRNRLLAPSHREIAPKFYQSLSQKSSLKSIKSDLKKNGFEVDYIEEYEGRRYGAVYLDSVRLIDNWEIPQ